MSKVISNKNLPARIPLLQIAVGYLMLDKFHAPSWLWGVMGTLAGLLLIAAFMSLHKQEEVDVLNETPTKSKWVQRLEEMQRVQKERKN